MAGETTRFRPGQSGNPLGRPKRKLVTEALVKELTRRAAAGEPTQAQQAAEKLVALMLGGDVAAAKLVLAYAEGLPAQPVEHGGVEGAPFTIQILRPPALEAGADAVDGD